jgi:hypothetical protein
MATNTALEISSGTLVWLKPSALLDQEFRIRFYFDVLRQCVDEHLPFVTDFTSDGTWAGISRDDALLRKANQTVLEPYHGHVHVFDHQMCHLSFTKPGISSREDMEALYG